MAKPLEPTVQVTAHDIDTVAEFYRIFTVKAYTEAMEAVGAPKGLGEHLGGKFQFHRDFSKWVGFMDGDSLRWTAKAINRMTDTPKSRELGFKRQLTVGDLLTLGRFGTYMTPELTEEAMLKVGAPKYLASHIARKTWDEQTREQRWGWASTEFDLSTQRYFAKAVNYFVKNRIYG